MKRINGQVVDVGQVGVVVKLDRLVDNREAALGELLLGLLPVHALRQRLESVEVEEVAVVATERALGPPTSRAIIIIVTVIR